MIFLLNTEKFATQKLGKKVFTRENIKDICDKNNWVRISLEEIKQQNYCLIVNSLLTEGIPLSDILEPVELDPICLIPTEKYRQITVLHHGRGVKFRSWGGKDFFWGSEIKTKRWKIKTNCLVLDRINSHRGAFGFVPSYLENSVVNKGVHTFFKIKEKYSFCDPLFLVTVLTSGKYLKYFAGLTHGSVLRWIYLWRFLSVKIELTESEFKKANQALRILFRKKQQLEHELVLINQKIKTWID